MSKKLTRIERKLTVDERRRHAKIRAAAEKEFPSKRRSSAAASLGIPATIRAEREAQGLTWYALAQKSRIPNQATIRDIELGKDVKISSLQAVAAALGLSLELTPSSVA